MLWHLGPLASATAAKMFQVASHDGANFRQVADIVDRGSICKYGECGVIRCIRVMMMVVGVFDC